MLYFLIFYLSATAIGKIRELPRGPFVKRKYKFLGRSKTKNLCSEPWHSSRDGPHSIIASRRPTKSGNPHSVLHQGAQQDRSTQFFLPPHSPRDCSRHEQHNRLKKIFSCFSARSSSVSDAVSIDRLPTATAPTGATASPIDGIPAQRRILLGSFQSRGSANGGALLPVARALGLQPARPRRHRPPPQQSQPRWRGTLFPLRDPDTTC